MQMEVPFGPGSKSAIYLQTRERQPVFSDILNAEYPPETDPMHDPDEHFFAYFDLLDDCKHTHTPLRPLLTKKICSEGGGTVKGKKPALCTKATRMREGVAGPTEALRQRRRSPSDHRRGRNAKHSRRRG